MSNQGNHESDIVALRNNRYFSRAVSTLTRYGILWTHLTNLTKLKPLIQKKIKNNSYLILNFYFIFI